jgi:hypothetical protein
MLTGVRAQHHHRRRKRIDVGVQEEEKICLSASLERIAATTRRDGEEKNDFQLERTNERTNET